MKIEVWKDQEIHYDEKRGTFYVHEGTVECENKDLRLLKKQIWKKLQKGFDKIEVFYQVGYYYRDSGSYSIGTLTSVSKGYGRITNEHGDSQKVALSSCFPVDGAGNKEHVEKIAEINKKLEELEEERDSHRRELIDYETFNSQKG